MKNENKDFEAFLRKNLKRIEMKVQVPETVSIVDQSTAAKRFFWLASKKGWITAATIVLLLLAGLTPQVRAIYQSWFGGPLVDRGLQQAEKQGNIQTPNASVTDQGITLTLQAVSADSTRTVLQVNVQGVEADDVHLDAVILSDEKGKTYRLQSQYGSGRMQFEPFDSGVKEAVLQVTSIKGVKGNWLIRFPVKRFESRIVTPNMKVQMPEGYTLTIHKIDFAPTQTQIDITFTSPYTPVWATITENGKVANLTRGSRDQKDPQLMHMFFDPVEGTQPMTLKLEFYNKPDVIVQIPRL